jgi:hypothetical protein
VIDAGTDGSWACLLVDGAGRPLATRRRGSEQVLARFTPEGLPDPSFGTAGYLPLPFEVHACTLDDQGRILLAGTGRDGDFAKAVVARVLNHDEAGAAGPTALPPQACAALDPDEPSELSDPARMTDVDYRCKDFTWSGMFIDSTDVDWFAFPAGNTNCDGQLAPTFAPSMQITGTQGAFEACLFVDTATLESGFLDCADGSSYTNLSATMRGCCAADRVGVSYSFTDPAVAHTIELSRLYVRILPSALAGTCDIYHVDLKYESSPTNP